VKKILRNEKLAVRQIGSPPRAANESINQKNETREDSFSCFMSMGYKKDIFAIFAYEFNLSQK